MNKCWNSEFPFGPAGCWSHDCIGKIVFPLNIIAGGETLLEDIKSSCVLSQFARNWKIRTLKIFFRN